LPREKAMADHRCGGKAVNDQTDCTKVFLRNGELHSGGKSLGMGENVKMDKKALGNLAGGGAKQEIPQGRKR